ncbi:MAG: T9SS type A sorting domain-containing protein [Paludibacteraceae bacterium]
MKSNIHFTGTRTLKLEWTIDGVTKTWTSSSLAKQTMLNWDMMLAMGIEPTKKPITVKFINTASSGGIRMYDFFVKVYDVTSGVKDIKIPALTFPMYQTETSLVVNGDIQKLNVYSMSGVLVANSTMSQLVEINHLNKGVYIVQIQDKEGHNVSQKFIKK